MKERIIVIVLLFMVNFCAKTQVNENIFLMKLGTDKVYLLSEGQRDGSASILIGADSVITEKYAPNNSFPMATNAFLWQTGGKNILFDTGYGKELFNNLKSLQIKPEDINVICITHMHGDHFGGLLLDNKVAFPKAELYVSQAEYDYWTSEETMNQAPENMRGGFVAAKKVLEAYKDHLHLFEPNAFDSKIYKELCFGILALSIPGHTPGHTAYLVGSGKDRLLIWGDLTHAMAVQMPHPEIAVSYDTNTELAVKSRLSVLQWVSKRAIPIAGMHIPYPGIGTIEESDPGYRFIPAK